MACQEITYTLTTDATGATQVTFTNLNPSTAWVIVEDGSMGSPISVPAGGSVSATPTSSFCYASTCCLENEMFTTYVSLSNHRNAADVGILTTDADVSAKVQAQLDDISSSGGGALIFGDTLSDNTYSFASQVTVPDNVEIVGCGKTVFKVTAGSLGRLFLTTAKNTQFRGFTIEGNGALFVAGIEFDDGAETGCVEKVCFYNGLKRDSTMDSVRINAAKYITTENTFHDHQYRAFHIRGGGETIDIERPVVRNIPNLGVFMRYSASKNIIVSKADVGPHLPDVVGNHFITGSNATTVTTTGLKILDSYFEGNPGVPFYRVAGVAVANGAAADMIAIRNTEDFLVDGNTVRHGGEFGITGVDGSSFGVISNNRIFDIDGSGIVIGASANVAVEGIKVTDNTIVRVGLDHQGLANGAPFLSKHSISGIRVFNCTNCRVWDNDLHDYATFGIFVNAPNTGAQTVFGFTHGDNTFASASADPEVFYGDATAVGQTATNNFTYGTFDADAGTAV